MILQYLLTPFKLIAIPCQVPSSCLTLPNIEILVLVTFHCSFPPSIETMNRKTSYLLNLFIFIFNLLFLLLNLLPLLLNLFIQVFSLLFFLLLVSLHLLLKLLPVPLYLFYLIFLIFQLFLSLFKFLMFISKSINFSFQLIRFLFFNDFHVSLSDLLYLSQATMRESVSIQSNIN